jgi:hypothetical protein
VRTPMIAPTGIYSAFPAMEPEEAGQILADAIIDKPKRISTRLGTAAQVSYALFPRVADVIANSAYKLFPEKDPKKREEEKRLEAEGKKPEKKKEEDLSPEGTMLAYLARGVYF